jgi:large repetitive protein
MMEDMNAFERQLAGVVRQTLRPPRPVDVEAIVTATTVPAGRWSVTTRGLRGGPRLTPTEGRFSLFSALKSFATAAAIMALFGGFLLASLARPQVEDFGAAAASSGPGVFSPAGSLERARSHHTATPLPDGRVLVIGGFDPISSEIAGVPTAEIWDSATSSFGPAGRLTTPRDGHAATLLPDGGVLVIGGWGNNVTSVEAWDPETESFSPAGSLAGPRLSATGTLLPDGRILVVGGLDPAVPSNSAELWDPTSASSQFGGVMGDGRWAHTATLLPDGRVLVVGGMDDGHTLASAEIWDPAAGSFEPTGSLAEGRDFHTATLLPDGRVLVVGGAFSSSSLRTSAELWDPATGAFSPAGALAIGRSRHTATLLPDGRVLVVGGGWENAQGSAELWDPATESFSPAASLAEGRWGHTATLLPDGRVLVVGGSSSASAEVWAPGDGTPAADEDVE